MKEERETTEDQMLLALLATPALKDAYEKDGETFRSINDVLKVKDKINPLILATALIIRYGKDTSNYSSLYARVLHTLEKKQGEKDES